MSAVTATPSFTSRLLAGPPATLPVPPPTQPPHGPREPAGVPDPGTLPPQIHDPDPADIPEIIDPESPQHPRLQSMNPAQDPSPPTGGRRVLVADDNTDAAESLSEVLRLLGHDVRVAYDGQQALHVAAEFRPEVVLLDIGMPKLNGYETAQRMRSQPWAAQATLVALTGWGEDDDRRRASDAGFDRHFTKPVDPAELLQMLEG